MKKNIVPYITNLIGVLLIFAVFSLLFGLKVFGKSTLYFEGICTTACYTIVMVTSLNLIVGCMGEFSLGHAGFVSVGAYTSAIVSNSLAGKGIPDLGLFLIAILAGGIAAGVMGILVGVPALRLRGDYLAIVTLAFGEIIRLVLVNWTDFSNGYAGISGIPRPTFFGIPVVSICRRQYFQLGFAQWLALL